MDGNQITNEVSCSTKCGSDLQTFKHDENLIENLCFQILVISRQNTPSMLVFIRAQHSHFHQVLLANLPFIPFVVTSLPLARSLRILTISNSNFWFCWFKSVCLQAEFFKVSHSFDFLLSAWRRQRFAGGLFATYDDQKIELDFIAYSVAIKLIPTWHHEVF